MNRPFAAALAGFLLFNLLLALAVLSNPSLTFFQDYLSSYGNPLAPSAPFFNYGCMFAGMIVVGVFYLLRKSATGKLGTAACAAGMLSGIALLGVGLFPTTTPPHYTFSFAYFALAGIAVLAFTVSNARKKGYANLLFALGALQVLLSAAFLFAEISRQFAPFFETVTVFAFEAWVLAAAYLSGKVK